MTAVRFLTLDAEGLHADEHAVEIVENYMEEDIDLILAVGSGTIHDISRYLATVQNSLYSVPTAASVDGFVSNVAAMTWKGLKNSTGSGVSCIARCVWAECGRTSPFPVSEMWDHLVQ